MNKKIYEFSVETRWTIPAKYTSNVTVYEDRVEIARSGRLNALPEKVTVYFANVSSVVYTKDTDYILSYISFTGVSSSKSQSLNAVSIGNVTAGIASANPWKDPYGIVFKLDMYQEGKEFYQKINAAFEKYRQNNTRPVTHNVITQESSVDKLKKLKDLKDLGIITEHEYEEKRLKLLAEI